MNELKEPFQFIKHADKKEVTECANYKESQVIVAPIQDISHYWTFHKNVTKVTCPTNFLKGNYNSFMLCPYLC